MEYHKLLQEYSPGSEGALVEGGSNWFLPKTGPELVRRVLFMLLASSPLRNLYIDSQKRMVLTRHMLLGRHPSETPVSAYFDLKGKTNTWNVPENLRGLEKFASGESFLNLESYPVVSKQIGARWVFPLMTSSPFNSSHLALLKRHSQQLVDSNDFSSTRGWKRILITFIDNMSRGGHHRVLYKLPDGKCKEHYFAHFLSQLTWILIRNILDNKGNPAITRLIEESTKLTKDKVCLKKTGKRNQNLARVSDHYNKSKKNGEPCLLLDEATVHLGGQPTIPVSRGSSTGEFATEAEAFEFIPDIVRRKTNFYPVHLFADFPDRFERDAKAVMFAALNPNLNPTFKLDLIIPGEKRLKHQVGLLWMLHVLLAQTQHSDSSLSTTKHLVMNNGKFVLERNFANSKYFKIKSIVVKLMKTNHAKSACNNREAKLTTFFFECFFFECLLL